MRLLKSYLLLTLIVALSSTIAVADRIGTNLPVKVGVGNAVNTNIIFDIGSGSTNPMIQSTSAGVLKLSNDETNFVTVPSANDTMCVLAATQTLTNKTMLDTTTTVANASDATKKYVWDLSGATTGTKMTIASPQTANRTLTLPDATDTLTANAATQTLTTKTISGGTLTGTIAGSPTFSGSPSFSGGLSFGGNITATISGSADGLNISMPNTAGDALVINNRTFGSTDATGMVFLQDNSGNAFMQNNNNNIFIASSGGAMSLQHTGGNVPHVCVSRHSTGGSVSCNAGEIATGGGCTCGTAQSLQTSGPSPGTDGVAATGWNCSWTASCVTSATYAICCAY